MRLRASVKAAAMVSIALCSLAAQAQNVAREVGDGLVFKQIEIAGDLKGVFLQVNLGKFDVRVLTALVPLENVAVSAQASPERAARGYFLRDYRRMYEAVAVLAGGYIANFSPPTPLGLIKSNGVVGNGPHDSWLTEGVFCSDSGRAWILKLSQIGDRQFRDCLQAGPLLLLDGKQPTGVPSVGAAGYQRLANAVQEQTFICVSPLNQVVLGVTDKMNFRTLVSFLLRPEVGCFDALRLTGQQTAGLVLGSQTFGNDNYLYPSVIAVMPRQ